MSVAEPQPFGCFLRVGFFKRGKILPVDDDTALALKGAGATQYLLAGIRLS